MSLGIIAGAIALCVVVIWYVRRPYYQQLHLAELPAKINTLLSEFDSGGALSLFHSPSGSILRLEKGADVGDLRYLFSTTKRVDDCTGRLKECLRAKGIPSEKEERTGPRVTVSFRVSCVGSAAESGSDHPAIVVVEKTLELLECKAANELRFCFSGPPKTEAMIENLESVDESSRVRRGLKRLLKAIIEREARHDGEGEEDDCYPWG